MKPAQAHLNLLLASERLSSSPVRVRVMLPVVAILACVAMLVWWGTVAMRGVVLSMRVSTVQEDLIARKNAHGAILSDMAQMRELESQTAQLKTFRDGRAEYGGFFAQLARDLPEKMQLLSLAMLEPPPQELTTKVNGRVVRQYGPTNRAETVKLSIVGRAADSQTISDLMAKLESPEYARWLQIDKKPDSPTASPNIRSIRQEAENLDGLGAEQRMLAFEVEYRMADRRFGNE